ncbi:MAG: hypothetical protein HY075_14995 [Deltaproteobacteria bacterium]|nr:hypothetical protein [Deltaproteobacteria bacterium]
MKNFCIVLLSLLAVPASALAMECDNFTGRDRPVKDALDVLNTYTNELLDAALAKANDTDKKCDRERLFRKLDRQLATTPVGIVEKWAEHSKLIERLQDDPNSPESIYNGFNGWKYPLLKASGIANSIRVNGHVIGTDKLGHFMAEGYKTYQLWSEEGGSLERAMGWGIRTEESYFGLLVSCIKSYADLAANYAGATFYWSIVDGKSPYFTCREGKFVRVRDFDWKDYVTDAWDEAINCSQFTRSMGATVLTNLGRRGQTCPLAGFEKTCAELSQLAESKWFLSPACKRLALSTSAVPTWDPGILVLSGRRGD